MKINNIFSSIQGEGFFSGLPTLFVRLFGCNLRCSYCDATEAIEGEGLTDLSVREVAERVLNDPAYDVTVTGGEPLVQEEELLRLLEMITPHRRVSIETNGSLDVAELRKRFPDVYLSMDWKTPASGCSYFCRKNLDLIGDHGWIKFVVGSLEDLRFVESVLAEVVDRGVPVIISPVFEEGSPLFREVSDFVMKYGRSGVVRMQLQLHKIVGVE